jgi:hypothetical protein
MSSFQGRHLIPIHKDDRTFAYHNKALDKTLVALFKITFTMKEEVVLNMKDFQRPNSEDNLFDYNRFFYHGTGHCGDCVPT